MVTLLILTTTVPPTALGYTPQEAASFGWVTVLPLVVFVLVVALFLLGLGLLHRI